MYIKSIIIPVENLQVIHVDNTVGEALDIISKFDYLSLPVVEGRKFIGVLSKRFVFETFFNDDQISKEDFLNKPVKDFMKTKIPTLDQGILVEDAADLFLDKKLQFIPVVDEYGNFEGIITPHAVLERYKRIFGSDYPRIIIYTYDFKGKLSKIIDIVTKEGGDIRNIVQLDTELLGLQEIYLRIKASNVEKIVKHLESQGFKVRAL